jgi:capsule polysaccharide export protein KpsE/RkpR
MKRERKKPEPKGFKKYLWLIITFFILIIAVFTNPEKDIFLDKISSEIYSDYEPVSDSEYAGIEMLGMSFAGRILDNMITVDNYILFSIAKVNFMGEKKAVAFGFFGQVILTGDAEDSFN